MTFSTPSKRSLTEDCDPDHAALEKKEVSPGSAKNRARSDRVKSRHGMHDPAILSELDVNTVTTANQEGPFTDTSLQMSNDVNPADFASLQLADSRDLDPDSLAAKKQNTLATLYCTFSEGHQGAVVSKDSMEEIMQFLKHICHLDRSSVFVDIGHNQQFPMAAMHAAQNYAAAGVGMVANPKVYHDAACHFLNFMESTWLRNHRVALLYQTNVVTRFDPLPFATHFMVHGSPSVDLLHWMAAASCCTCVVVLIHHFTSNHSDRNEWLTLAKSILDVTAIHRLEHLEDTLGHGCEAFVLQRKNPSYEESPDPQQNTVHTPNNSIQMRPLVDRFISGSVQDTMQAYRQILSDTRDEKEAVKTKHAGEKSPLAMFEPASNHPVFEATPLSKSSTGSKDHHSQQYLPLPAGGPLLVNTRRNSNGSTCHPGDQCSYEENDIPDDKIRTHSMSIPPAVVSFDSVLTTSACGQEYSRLAIDPEDIFTDGSQEEPLEILTSPSLSEQIAFVGVSTGDEELEVLRIKERRNDLLLALIICLLSIFATPFASNVLGCQSDHPVVIDVVEDNPSKAVSSSQISLYTRGMFLMSWSESSTYTNDSFGAEDGSCQDHEAISILSSAKHNATNRSNYVADSASGSFDPMDGPYQVDDAILALGEKHQAMNFSIFPPSLRMGCCLTKEERAKGMIDTGSILTVEDDELTTEHCVHVPPSWRDSRVFDPELDAEDSQTRLRRTIRFYEAVLVYFRHTMLGIVSRAVLPGFIKSVTALHIFHEQISYVRVREKNERFELLLEVDENAICTFNSFRTDVMGGHGGAIMTSRDARNIAVAPKAIPTYFPVWGKLTMGLSSSRDVH